MSLPRPVVWVAAVSACYGAVVYALRDWLSPQHRQLALLYPCITGVQIGLAYYTWTRLVRACAWGPSSHAVLTKLVVAFFVLAMSGFFLNGALAGPEPSSVALVCLTCTGSALLVIMATLVTDGLLLLSTCWGMPSSGGATVVAADPLLTGPDREPPLVASVVTLSRLRTRAWVVLALTLLGTVVGILSVAQGPQLVHVDLTLSKLPVDGEGFRLVQLSDIHLSATIGVEFVKSIVARVQALQPDAVVITGDLFDGTIAQVRASTEPLRVLAASTRHGVFFVTGNHEYYRLDPSLWFPILADLGVVVLHNARRTVVSSNNTPLFELAGVDDWTAHRFATPAFAHGANVPAAVTGRNPALPLILLAHNPHHIHDSAAHGVDVQLSGHTHGGQIFPMHIFTWLFNPYFAGWYQHHGSDGHIVQLYVSRGTAYWGPPLRLFADSEITVHTLRRRSVKA